MKTFKLSIFKGANNIAIVEKEVLASNIEELKVQKNAFKNEYRCWFNNPKNWLGVKRIK